MLKIFISCAAVILIITSCKPTENSQEKKNINALSSRSDYYQEEHRNQFHFSPEENWMNDPNGMVYYDGEYHLYYQYYPDSTVWGPMHWGHAVSPDMVRWEHLPIALYPDSLGLIFSGSAVIDKDNTAGFGKNAMVVIYTYHDLEAEQSGTSKTFQYQAIAYSNDKGRTFTKYEGNPVIDNPGIKDFRDPKVIWDVKNEQWVMVFAAYDKALFYTSPNLKDWKRTGEFGIEGDSRLWECPDLFPMKIEGSDETKWVLITSIQKEGPNGGTATSYFVGDFDGKTFIGNPEEQMWLDYGKDNYAFVTWSDIPNKDGRRLGLGWMSNWQYAQVVPTEKWRSAMTLPRSLRLFADNNSYHLRSLPVAELNSLENKQIELAPKVFTSEESIYKNEQGVQAKLELSFEKPQNGLIDVRLKNDDGELVSLGFDASNSYYFVDRSFSGKDDFSEDFADLHTAPVIYAHDQVNLVIYIDRASVEMFADDGRTSMAEIFFPEKPFTEVSIMADLQDVNLLKGKIIELEDIWTKK